MAIRASDHTKQGGIVLCEPTLLLVEGPDDQLVFKKLAELERVSDIQIISMNGNTNWQKRIRALQNTSGFANVTSIGLIQDADNDFPSVLDSLKDCLRTLKFPIPDAAGSVQVDGKKRGGIFVCHNGERYGELEDICLAALDGDERIECVNMFIDCLDNARGARHPEASKAKIAAFLASQDRPWLKLGVAAENMLLPLDHDAFRPARDFLNYLAI